MSDFRRSAASLAGLPDSAMAAPWTWRRDLAEARQYVRAAWAARLEHGRRSSPAELERLDSQLAGRVLEVLELTR